MILVLERFLLSAAVAGLIYTIAQARRKVRFPRSRQFGEPYYTADTLSETGGFAVRNSWKNLTWAAGIPMPFYLFGFLVLEFSAFVCLLLWGAFASRVPGMLAMIILPVATGSVLIEIARQRALKYEETLVQAVELMIAALRSGDTLRGAIAGVAENAQSPVKEEFGKLDVKLDLGFAMKRALAPMVLAYDSEGLRLFAASLTAKASMGGDHIPLLESLSQVLRERHRFRMKVSSQIAGAKMASLMIGFSPYLLLALFWVYKRDWIERIFDHPHGPAFFIGAICLQMVGFLGILRMQRIEL